MVLGIQSIGWAFSGTIFTTLRISHKLPTGVCNHDSCINQFRGMHHPRPVHFGPQSWQQYTQPQQAPHCKSAAPCRPLNSKPFPSQPYGECTIIPSQTLSFQTAASHPSVPGAPVLLHFTAAAARAHRYIRPEIIIAKVFIRVEGAGLGSSGGGRRGRCR